MFVVIVLLVVAVGILAVTALSRVTKSSELGLQVGVKMGALQAALVQFVTANGRLPCPADPTLDDGVAVPAVAGPCTHATGTVPWRSIGVRRDDAIDPWARKIAYRVYTGAAGSLTQDGGASLVDCDTSDSGARDPATGLCVSGKDTGPAQFLAGKGLTLTDMGTARSDVAFVLISHGSTGYGGYTTAGQQLTVPAAGGDEGSNLQATGPFVIKAFSPAGTDPAAASHFDDYLSYRRIEDLVRSAGVYARNWPEEEAAAGTVSDLKFDHATVDAAVGSPVTPGTSTGQVSVSFLGAVVSANVAGNTAAELTFDVHVGRGGLGVAGNGSLLIQSSADERVVVALDKAFRKFAVTLNDFGEYGAFRERVQLRFFRGETSVGATWEGVGCKIDGGLASFSADVGVLFDTVEVRSVSAVHTSDPAQQGISAFLLSEIAACADASGTCETTLANPGNTCTIAANP